MKKLSAVYGALIIVIAVFLFFASQSFEEHPLMQRAEKVVNNSGASNRPVRDELGSQATDDSSSLPSQDPDPHSQLQLDTPKPFLPVIEVIVSQEKLKSDIEDWKQQMEEKGLAGITEKGNEWSLMYAPAGDKRGDPDSLNKYSKSTTLEEIVALAEGGDPAAMLALANTAYSARRWAEGDYYAIESARMAGSSEPILHGAVQRQRHSMDPFHDRDTASWFLAAYLEGNLSAAMPVEAYIRTLDIETQRWVVSNAYEIIAQLHEGG